MVANEGEEDRHEVDRAVKSDAQNEAQNAAEREVAVDERAQIHKWLPCPPCPHHEQRARAEACGHECEDGRRSPAAPWRLLERDLQASQRNRHQAKSDKVDGAQV